MKNKKEILNEAIVLLENKQAMELKLLREQFHTTYESLKPINLLKSTFKEMGSSPDLKKDILNAAVSLATGYLTKSSFLTDNNSPLKKMVGTALKFALAKVVSNSDTLINTGESFLQRFMKNKTGVNQEFSKN